MSVSIAQLQSALTLMVTLPKCPVALDSTVFSLDSTCFLAGKSWTVTVTATLSCTSWASSTMVSSFSSRRILGQIMEYLWEMAPRAELTS